MNTSSFCSTGCTTVLFRPYVHGFWFFKKFWTSISNRRQNLGSNLIFWPSRWYAPFPLGHVNPTSHTFHYYSFPLIRPSYTISAMFYYDSRRFRHFRHIRLRHFRVTIISVFHQWRHRFGTNIADIISRVSCIWTYLRSVTDILLFRLFMIYNSHVFLRFRDYYYRYFWYFYSSFVLSPIILTPFNIPFVCPLGTSYPPLDFMCFILVFLIISPLVSRNFSIKACIFMKYKREQVTLSSYRPTLSLSNLKNILPYHL